jgi:hypothetical protein
MISACDAQARLELTGTQPRAPARWFLAHRRQLEALVSHASRMRRGFILHQPNVALDQVEHRLALGPKTPTTREGGTSAKLLPDGRRRRDCEAHQYRMSTAGVAPRHRNVFFFFLHLTRSRTLGRAARVVTTSASTGHRSRRRRKDGSCKAVSMLIACAE